MSNSYKISFSVPWGGDDSLNNDDGTSKYSELYQMLDDLDIDVPMTMDFGSPKELSRVRTAVLSYARKKGWTLKTHARTKKQLQIIILSRLTNGDNNVATAERIREFIEGTPLDSVLVPLPEDCQYKDGNQTTRVVREWAYAKERTGDNWIPIATRKNGIVYVGRQTNI